ncbi:GxxExxY protein [Betaproteobacteria bacterium GR16-43]|nr:GxxExxY protein [Betaproteobacteria bacterium GR16-43]
MPIISDAELVQGPLTRSIIGSAIEVHQALGPGLLEGAYRACLRTELLARNLAVRQEVQVPVNYKGVAIDCGFRADLIVEESVVIELKAVERLLPIHDAQLLTYLKLTGLEVGLILNFNSASMRNGVRRLILQRE